MRRAGQDFTESSFLSALRLRRVLIACLALLLLAKAVFFFIRAARTVGFPYEWSTMDGYFVYYGLRLISGKPIYFGFESLLMPFEYVPVYPAVIGLLAKIFGPGVWYERTFSLVCSLGIAALVAKAVSRRTADRMAAVIAGLLFFAPASLSVWHIVRGIDIFAALLALAGVSIIAETDERSNFRIVTSTAILVLAFYSKQTTVFSAATAMLFVFSRHFKKGLLMGAGYAAAVAVVFFLIQWLSHGWFYESAFLTTAKNPYIPHLLTSLFLKYLLALIVIFPIALFQASRGISRRPDVWTIYFFFTLLSSLLAGKAGAALSYFIPLFSATCISFGLFIGDSGLSKARPRLFIAALGVLLIQASLFFKESIPVPTLHDFQQAALLDEYIKEHPGEILTERIDSFAILNGRELNVEAVQLPILILRGKFDSGKLGRAIRNRQFALIIYSGNYLGGLPAMRNAIFEHYREIGEVDIGLFTGNTSFRVFVPR